jgi:hypothetical protein
MSSEINIHNLFNILHPIWIHHTKNWIFLAKQSAHLQMTMKNCTKSYRKRSEHQLFRTLHPYRSTTIHKIIGFSHSGDMNIYNKLSNKVSSLSIWLSRKRNEHKLFHTLHPSWIHHNSYLDPLILTIYTSPNENDIVQSFKSPLHY